MELKKPSISDEIAARRLAREKAARLQAEAILELKSEELYAANKKLNDLVVSLDELVAMRNSELSHIKKESEIRAMAILDSNIRTDLVLSATKTGIWEVNYETGEVHCSDTLTHILKMSRKEVAQRLHNQSLPAPEYRSKLLAAYERSAKQHKMVGIDEECEMILGNGERRWVRLVAKMQYASRGIIKSTVGAVIDIHEKVKDIETIHHLATHDALTQIPNRSTFTVKLGEVIKAAKENKRNFSLAILDLNGFKLINDVYGHQAGDHVLVNIAKNIQSVIRKTDLLARLGGDEFALIIDGHHDSGAIERICTNIMHTCNDFIGFEGEDIFTSVAIGVSIFDDTSLDAEALIRQADLAMYQVKKGKGLDEDAASGVCFFSKDLEDEALNRKNKKLDLENAIRNGEFQLFFQPVYCVKKGVICGAEALIRKVCHDGRIEMPYTFIPFAEEVRLIGEISAWVIDTACRQAKTWLDQGIDITIKVNISAQEFESETLPQLFRNTFAKYQISGRCIGVEVTESCMIGTDSNVAWQLEAFREMGIEISIDDFGTGYSSLSYLHTLPYEIIKIDKSFISRLNDCHESRVILNTLVTLAKSLGKKIIAEGVEELEQLEYLQEIRCDFVQGYYYAPAVTAEEFEILL